jgi:hypothetical protein
MEEEDESPPLNFKEPFLTWSYADIVVKKKALSTKKLEKQEEKKSKQNNLEPIHLCENWAKSSHDFSYSCQQLILCLILLFTMDIFIQYIF